MLTVVLIFVTYAICTWWCRSTNNNEPPAWPGRLPLIGHGYLLLRNNINFWKLIEEKCYECLKFGGVMSGFIGPRPFYVVADPEDSLRVANACLQKPFVYQFAKPWTGNGLVTADLSTWGKHRRLLSPAFNRSILDGYIDIYNGQARRLVKDLEVEIGKGPFDHRAYVHHHTLDIICLTSLGLDLTDKSVENTEYVHATDKMFDSLLSRLKRFWLYNDVIYNWSSLKRKQDKYLKIFHNTSNTILEKRKTHYLNKRKNKENKENTQDSKFKSFMDLLVELAIETGTFNDKEIKDHVNTIIIAGYDTTATVLIYALLMIGSYPKVQEKILDELHNVIGDNDMDVSKEHLTQLVYLEAVLKETMRLYPVVPVLPRHLDRDVKLRNYTLLKGRACYILVYGMHRHPMWGADAEEFKPERWLNPTTLPECHAAFAVFSLGKRMCIGKAQAYMLMKTSLAHICRKYKIHGVHSDLKNTFELVLKPESGFHITIETR